MGNIIKLSPYFLAQLKSKGHLTEWKRPMVISEEEVKRMIKNNSFKK